MRIKKEEIPVTMQAPGTIMRGLPGWGGMTVAIVANARIGVMYWRARY